LGPGGAGACGGTSFGGGNAGGGAGRVCGAFKMKERNFFFEKKKQKTFAPFGRCMLQKRCIKESKFFAALFFKKARTSL
jgi:hypothetical protein